MKNPYSDEFEKAFEECHAKYGAFEDDELIEFNGIKSRKPCVPWNYPEWSDVCRKYSEEEEKIERFRDKSMKSGLASFTKWFWNLWD